MKRDKTKVTQNLKGVCKMGNLKLEKLFSRLNIRYGFDRLDCSISADSSQGTGSVHELLYINEEGKFCVQGQKEYFMKMIGC